MKNQKHPFGSSIEAFVYPLLLLASMWVMLWAEKSLDSSLVTWGIRPGHLSSWIGVFFMPLLHDNSDFGHILNNSLPTAILFGALIYYYREVAFRVFFWSWIGTGMAVWLLAEDTGAYHIGMSGVIYALFGFLFVSGFFRKFMPLQAVSLFVVFLYGSMIWGIFPQKSGISWEGHLSGFLIGVFFAIWYRKVGPTPPKYQFEIEKELGIEPPDLEGIWLERQLEVERINEELERNQSVINNITVVYHYTPKPKEEKPSVDTEN